MRVTRMNAFNSPPRRRGAANNNVFEAKPLEKAEKPIMKNQNRRPDLKALLSKFEKDDYILAGLIIVLIFEGCDDYILLAALGYLFIMGLLPTAEV